MKLIRGIYNINYNLSDNFNGCVLTIGNFDGVHRGHQILLNRLHKESISRDLPIVLVIFEPQPLEFFYGNKAPARITRLREKLYFLKQQNIDYVLCINFNKIFASLKAQDFVVDILVKKLKVKFLSVGEDFRFGVNREGDFTLLKKIGIKYGFNVVSTQTLYDGKLRISSTFIRKALLENKLEIAEDLLGHPFIVSGRVIHGNEIGRKIGFPTANILLGKKNIPVKGVYVVEVIGLDNYPLPGMANIGTCKTIGGIKQQLEVHLFDIMIDLYDHYINVVLKKKIRDEKQFASIYALKKQISSDELIARAFWLSNASLKINKLINYGKYND